MISALFEWTIFTFRFTPGNGFINLILFTVINTAIKLSGLYLLVRVLATAIKHGLQ